MNCYSCSRCHVVGQPPKPPKPAVQRWTCPNGNVVSLCRMCAVRWAWNATDDPSLEPLTVTPIP